MMRFDRFLTVIAGLVCGLSDPLCADELTLAGGESRLTGVVLSIDRAGVVELDSVLSPEHLRLKAEAVEKVGFSNDGADETQVTERVELANGDVIPAKVVALDERMMTLDSPHAGRLEVPRASLKSLQLGMRESEVIYEGPAKLDEWAMREQDRWKLRRDMLVAQGEARAWKEFDLPERFVLQFTLGWERKQVPNFQVYFADPLVAVGALCDRYYVQFSGAGLELRREAAQGKRYNTLLLLNRTPNQYPDQSLRVEVRVDRRTSKLQLLLNGEPEGEVVDPIPSVPKGAGVTVVCNTPGGGTQSVGGIRVLKLEDSHGRHRAERRGDPELDSLISRDEDRWSGALLGVEGLGGERVFRFKSDFQDAPLEIPATDVSTVFFAEGEPGEEVERHHPFVLRLRGGGSLQVESCRFSGASVTAEHALLGELGFDRNGIVGLERVKRAVKEEEP